MAVTQVKNHTNFNEILIRMQVNRSAGVYKSNVKIISLYHFLIEWHRDIMFKEKVAESFGIWVFEDSPKTRLEEACYFQCIKGINLFWHLDQIVDQQIMCCLKILVF